MTNVNLTLTIDVDSHTYISYTLFGGLIPATIETMETAALGLKRTQGTCKEMICWKLGINARATTLPPLLVSHHDMFEEREKMSYCRYNADEQSFRFEGGTRSVHGHSSGSSHWAVFSAKTAEEIRRGTVWSCAPTDEEIQQWHQQAIALVQRWGHRLSDLEQTLYIRYGDLPKGGRSTNYVTGRKEQGVSVYPAKYDLETGAIIFDDEAGVHNPGTLFFFVGVRIPHLVTGQYVGTGSDGEPLLRRVQIRTALRYDAALKGFVAVDE